MGMYFPSIKITQVAWSLDRNVATALGIWSGWEYYTFWPFGWWVSTVSHEEIDWEGDMPAQDPYLFYSFNGAYSRSPRRVCFNRNCLRSGNQDPSGEWIVPPHRGVHSNSPSQRTFPLQIMVHNSSQAWRAWCSQQHSTLILSESRGNDSLLGLPYLHSVGCLSRSPQIRL